MRLDDGQSRQVAQPALQARARFIHALLHTVHGRGEIHFDRAQVDAELGRAPRHVGHACRLAQRLGRRAAPVDTGAAEITRLNQSHLAALGHQLGGQKRPCLTGTDDDGVVRLGGHHERTSTPRQKATRPATASAPLFGSG